MTNEIAPAIGSWYELDTGEVFTVTGLDLPRGVIDIEYVDGRVDQVDPDTWRGLDLVEVEAPADWHGSIQDYVTGRRERF